ncbi:hypothetical protein V6Z11_D13G200000 [Gossypium hirsutum]
MEISLSIQNSKKGVKTFWFLPFRRGSQWNPSGFRGILGRRKPPTTAEGFCIVAVRKLSVRSDREIHPLPFR